MSDIRPLYALAFVLAVTGCDTAPPTTPRPPSPGVSNPAPPIPPNPPQPIPEPGTGESITGVYQLDLSVGESCAALPIEARHRTYTATIEPAGARNVVTLTGGSFLDGSICTMAPSRLGCNQFLASRAGDQVRLDLINENDDGHGGHIVEQVPPSTWIEVIGSATGDIKDGNITATGTASVWYCRGNAGYPFPCATYGGCESDLRMTLTRK